MLEIAQVHNARLHCRSIMNRNMLTNDHMGSSLVTKFVGLSMFNAQIYLSNKGRRQVLSNYPGIIPMFS